MQVTGTWKSSPARGQSHELVADQIDVLGAADIEVNKQRMSLADIVLRKHGPCHAILLTLRAIIQNYPIQKKFQSVEFLRSLPHLRLRLPANAVQARFRSQCLAFVTRFLSSTDYSSGHFVQVQPPVITSSDCEGAGEVFTVLPAADTTISSSKQSNDASTKKPSFFKTAKYLSVSSQLHLEAYAAALGNVWALSPTFRAEKSDTSRHLAEFYMLEAEMSFVFSLHTLTGLVEHLIKSLVSDDAVRDQWQELILALRASHGSSSQAGKVEDLEGRWEVLQGEPWKQVSYSVCMARLVDAAAKNPSLFQHQPIPGSSLHLEHERWIVEHVSRNRPIFVTDYPKAIKPFYMAPSELSRTRVGLARESGEDVTNDDAAEVGEVEKDDRSKAGGEDGHQRQESVACFDLLFPFGAGEIAGGSLREHRLEHLIQNLRQNGMLRSGIDDTAPSASSSSSSSPSSHNSCTIPHKDDSNLFPSTSTAYPPPPPPATASATTSATASTRPTYPHLTPYESLGPLKWYVDLRRHGTVPHGGFGIGWDRLLAYLTGVENLKDMVAFPRSYGKAEC